MPPVNPDALNIPAFWVKPQPVPSGAAGAHRWSWDLRYTAPPAQTARPGGGGGFGRNRGEIAQPGTYTVKLTVGGKTLSEPLTIKPDPRSSR